jgi:hypothetical protein
MSPRQSKHQLEDTLLLLIGHSRSMRQPGDRYAEDSLSTCPKCEHYAYQHFDDTDYVNDGCGYCDCIMPIPTTSLDE